MTESTFENAYDYLGFFGGLLFALGFFPQIYKQIKTGSSRDLSIAWLFAYLLGITSYGIYAVSYKLWPVVGPLCLELVCVSLSIGIKLFSDRKWRRNEKQRKLRELPDFTKPASVDEAKGRWVSSGEEDTQGAAIINLPHEPSLPSLKS